MSKAFSCLGFFCALWKCFFYERKGGRHRVHALACQLRWQINFNCLSRERERDSENKLIINNFNYIMKLSNYTHTHTHSRDQVRRKRRSLPSATATRSMSQLQHALCIYYYYFYSLPYFATHLTPFLVYLLNFCQGFFFGGGGGTALIGFPSSSRGTSFKLCLSLQWNLPRWDLKLHTTYSDAREGRGRVGRSINYFIMFENLLKISLCTEPQDRSKSSLYATWNFYWFAQLVQPKSTQAVCVCVWVCVILVYPIYGGCGAYWIKHRKTNTENA